MKTKHGAEHHIRVKEGPPISSKFRRLDPVKFAAAKAKFDQLEREGIIRRSDSPWASPLHMVKKADGSWRPCGDYRRLNLITIPDAYPLPNMMDFAARMSGCTIFSKVDLRKGYHQIPMHANDICKTAIITPFGLYEYLRMGFGLRNAGNTFQRMMDRVASGMPFVFVYLDDIIVGSRDIQSHVQHLRLLFQRLRDHGLVINGEKCEFGARELDFLGHRVSAAGVAPLRKKVEAIQTHPRPGSLQELQGFLGTVNFYRRFLPAAAKLLRPLTDALRGGKAAKEQIQWTAEMEQAFSATKQALAKAALLAHPTPGAEVALMVDASGYHVGAALQQRTSAAAAWQPLGFYSKKLDSAQRRYSAFDRELLACSSGIRHFRHMLDGRPFAVYTDHKPLTFALSRATDAWTPRQGRHLSYVAEFTADIRYIPGKENVVADTLSRPPGAAHTAGPDSSPHTAGPDSSTHTAGPDSCSHTAGPDSCSHTAGPDSWSEEKAAGLNSLAGPAAVAAIPPASSARIDLAAMAAAQPQCRETMLLQRTTSLNIVPQRIAGVLLLCDVSQGRPRPAVPACHRRQVFAAVHEVAHPGVRATRRLIARRFAWKGMATDVAAWTRDCQQCQRGKVTAQPAAAVEPIPVPARRFSHIHVDLVGPLPTSAAGYSYLFTAVDRSTRWLEAIPLKDMSAASCADALISGWVSRFGVPSLITSDRGTQFTSAVWEALCNKLGVAHTTTTAYHPQANGLVERAHRQLKEALRSRLAGAAWPDHLPWALLGLRAAPKDDSNISSAELVYGAPLVLPGEFLDTAEPPAAEFLEHMRALPTSIPTRPLPPQPQRVPGQLLQASWVYVRRGGTTPPLTPPYAGPYEVLEPGEKTFLIRIGNKEDRVSVDRLKPHLGKEPVQPAAPSRRGRPKNVQGAACVASPPTYAEVAAGGGPSVAVLQRSNIQ